MSGNVSTRDQNPDAQRDALTAAGRDQIFVDKARLGKARFERLVRAEVVRRGRTKPCLRILNKLWTAMADPAGVIAHWAGGFERISWILDDWDAARTSLVDVELAGLAPRERLSGTFTGKARLSGAGRPGLRTAAWRAVWGCLHANHVYAARYRHLTTREHNRLKPTQAQTVIAAALSLAWPRWGPARLCDPPQRHDQSQTGPGECPRRPATARHPHQHCRARASHLDVELSNRFGDLLDSALDIWLQCIESVRRRQ